MNLSNPYGMSDEALAAFDARLAEVTRALCADRNEVAEAWFHAASDDFGSDFQPFEYLQAKAAGDVFEQARIAVAHCDAVCKTIESRLATRALEKVNEEREAAERDAREHDMRALISRIAA